MALVGALALVTTGCASSDSAIGRGDVEVGENADLYVSSSSARTTPQPLAGRTLSGNQYIFIYPADGISRVRFFLDDPTMIGTPRKIESSAPWDFAGTAADRTAIAFDTGTIADGQHSVTADITLTTGAKVLRTSTFNVANGAFQLMVSASPDRSAPMSLDGRTLQGSAYIFTTPQTGVSQVTFYLDDPLATGTPYRVEKAPPYDFAGTASSSTALPFDTTSIAAGDHSITAHVLQSDGQTRIVSADFSTVGGSNCSPVPCSEILVDTPYTLEFASNAGHVVDAYGVGTGFTYVVQNATGTGYKPELIEVDVSTGRLLVTTRAGIAAKTANNLDNALAVGLDAASGPLVLSTTLSSIPAGTGSWEQAGLHFGNDQSGYVKLVVMSTPNGTIVQYVVEVQDAFVYTKSSPVLAIGAATVSLELRTDPLDQTIAAWYRVGSGAWTALGSYIAPPEFFSFDAAGIDPEIGTRSFGGISATHRNATAPTVYAFDRFEARAGEETPSAGPVQFTRESFSVPMPTSMVWGPDGRLYVTELFGTIHAISFDAGMHPASDQVITTIGSRLTLGVTVDPLSTASNVILWVAHSSPSVNAGVANSGTVTRLSGAGLTQRVDVITGLPRAIANHSVNSLHFGPDDRLYIALGGNTGAGAPNTDNTEFGDRAEQPLSAALLVADVRNSTFDGSCANTVDMYGPAPCDVRPYATGLRNMYDFVFHSNGSIYGADNGLGVTGTYPPSPTPVCTGFGDTAPWDAGGNNPGPQPDIFVRIVQGRYYGHPNPYRDECVFKDGHYQGVAPLANYTPPILSLGNHRSSDGMVEYRGDVFCGDLEGEVLIANYSVGDDITRVRLSPDGTQVLSSSSLVGGFNDPLPLAMGPSGIVFVGEFNGDQVTILRPVDIGCWSAGASLPSTILDAGGAAVGGKVYVVGGKNSSGHVSTLGIYDPLSDTWTQGPNLPGPAVENPAVTVLNGRIYVAGGGTAAFSGAVTNFASFDPSTGVWTSLAPMSTARSGATAQALGGRIYVVGGMDGSGASLATMEVFDPATGAWSPSTPMAVRRDNPGSAALNGRLYVFGGRTRNADGSGTGTLNSVEAFDPATSTWSPGAPMPTGRRTMAVGTLRGRAQLVGGEVTSTGGAFDQNEEYDPLTNQWQTLRPIPAARHGGASATVDGVMYVIGGGLVGGSSYSSRNDQFVISAP